MKILIAGASGLTGKELLSNLSDLNHEVYGLIKDPNNKAIMEDMNAIPIIANLEDDVSDIAKDMDAVIFVVGARGQPIEKAKYVDYLGLTKVVASCTKHNVKRFLYISSLNVGKDKKSWIEQITQYYRNKELRVPQNLLGLVMHDKYAYYLKMKTLAEEEIIRSDLDYTIIRVGLLTNDKASNKVEVFPNKIDKFGISSRANIAQCFIEILNKENTYKKTYTVFDGETPIEKAFI